MNAKRIAPGKADQNTDVSEKPVAEPVRREHGSNQGAADQTQSDTISEHDEYGRVLSALYQRSVGHGRGYYL